MQAEAEAGVEPLPSCRGLGKKKCKAAKGCTRTSGRCVIDSTIHADSAPCDTSLKKKAKRKCKKKARKARKDFCARVGAEAGKHECKNHPECTWSKSKRKCKAA